MRLKAREEIQHQVTGLTAEQIHEQYVAAGGLENRDDRSWPPVDHVLGQAQGIDAGMVGLDVRPEDACQLAHQPAESPVRATPPLGPAVIAPQRPAQTIMNGEPCMGIVGDSLNRAVQQAFTRPIPKSAGAQMRYLVKQLTGTRAVAEALGVSQRTVERYVKDQIRRRRADLAQRLRLRPVGVRGARHQADSAPRRTAARGTASSTAGPRPEAHPGRWSWTSAPRTGRSRSPCPASPLRRRRSGCRWSWSYLPGTPTGTTR